MTGRSDSVAFLVEETEERMFADPFFLGMLRSAQEAVAGAGQQLVFTVANRPEDKERFLAYAAGGHVDGVLLLSLHGQDQLPQRLEAVGVPTVLSGRPLERPPPALVRRRRQRRWRPARDRAPPRPRGARASRR